MFILCLYPKMPGGAYLATCFFSHQLFKDKRVESKFFEVKNYSFVIPHGRLRLLRNFFTNSFVFLKFLKKVSKKTNQEVDFIYSPSILLLFLTVFFKKFKKAKLIFHFHGFDYGENDKKIYEYLREQKINKIIKYLYLIPFLYFFNLIEKFVLKKTFKIIVPTKPSTLFIIKRHPEVDKIYHKKIDIVPYSFDNQTFYTNLRKEKHSNWRIIYAGRMVKEKGVEELVRAFKTLDEDKFHLNMLYPSSEDVDFEKKIKNLIRGLDNITLIKNPSRKVIAEFYRQSDLSVIASITHFEQLPLSFIESIACGAPVLISHKIPALTVWQKENAPFLILYKINPQKIAEKIKFYCSLSLKERKKIIKKCLVFAQEFIPENSFRVFLDLFLSNK